MDPARRGTVWKTGLWLRLRIWKLKWACNDLVFAAKNFAAQMVRSQPFQEFQENNFPELSTVFRKTKNLRKAAGELPCQGLVGSDRPDRETLAPSLQERAILCFQSVQDCCSRATAHISRFGSYRSYNLSPSSRVQRGWSPNSENDERNYDCRTPDQSVFPTLP